MSCMWNSWTQDEKSWYYDPILMLEENKKAAEQKIKEKQEAKKDKAREAETKKEAAQTPAKKQNTAEVHKGTIVLLLPPKEKAVICLVSHVI